MLRVALAVALVAVVSAAPTRSASVHRLRFSFSQQGLPTEELPGSNY